MKSLWAACCRQEPCVKCSENLQDGVLRMLARHSNAVRIQASPFSSAVVLSHEVLRLPRRSEPEPSV